MTIEYIDSLEAMEKLTRKEPYVIVNFSGDNSYGCELLDPVYREVSFDLPGLIFAELDPGSAPDAMEKLGINAMPTLVYFRQGQEIKRTVGSMSRQDLLEAVAELLYE